MNITGQCMIWAKDYQLKDGSGSFRKYSAGIGKKQENGTYVNAYQPVRFRKEVRLHNGTKIDIKNAFTTVNSYQKDGKAVNTVEWMILDFDVIGSPEPEDAAAVPEQVEGFTQIQNEDIPF